MHPMYHTVAYGGPEGGFYIPQTGNLSHSDTTKTNPFSNFIGGLCGLVLLILSIYALVITNSEAITNACGPEIWNLLLVRTVLTGIMPIWMCVSVYCAIWLEGIGQVVHMLTILIITLVFMILEAIFATQAMQSSTCMTALDNADANGRMLPIILYVYMSFDCLMLFILLCFSFVTCCAISSEK